MMQPLKGPSKTIPISNTNHTLNIVTSYKWWPFATLQSNNQTTKVFDIGKRCYDGDAIPAGNTPSEYVLADGTLEIAITFDS